MRGAHALTRRQLRVDPPALGGVHENGVVACARELVGMAEVHAPLFEDASDLSRSGDDDELPAVAHPDCGLVRRLEPVDGRVGVVVGIGGHPVLSRLRDPACHAERRGDSWDHPAGAVRGNTAVAYEADFCPVSQRAGVLRYTSSRV